MTGKSLVKKSKNLRFNSQVIHAGQDIDPTTGAVMQPIYATSTYAQTSPGDHQGYEYSRSENPTRMAFERCLAGLEGGSQGLAFASGLAAVDAVLQNLPAKAHVVAMDDLYGGTFRLFNRIKTRHAGMKFTHIDMSDLNNLKQAITDETQMIWLETPSNPLLKVVDLEAIAEIARERGILTVCDNTFATPYNQQPLKLGIDVVMHSTTKYINGHSDIIGGALVIGDNQELAEELKFLQFAVGGIASPFDSFLALRGVKTLAVRMERHNQNAQAIAEFLVDHPAIDGVFYPGLPSHQDHELASRQMSGYSGMVSCYIKGGLDQTRRFMENLELFTLAESLGGVESLINHPAIMTHASVPVEQRKKLGIFDNLVRFSVGIEDVEDLIADINQALSKL
jgi:cystathionine gamma-lyase